MATYSGIVGNIIEIINNLVALGSALALFYFLWGIVKYLTHGDNEGKRKESVQTITYGLIALFVLVAVWSLVSLLKQSLLGNGGIDIPQF